MRSCDALLNVVSELLSIGCALALRSQFGALSEFQ